MHANSTWKVWRMVVPMALTVSPLGWSQPDAKLTPVVVPILEHQGRVLMAARVDIGRYDGRGLDRAELEGLFAGIDEALRWRWPEFVLLEHFRLFQVGDAEGSFALWDEESRAELAGGVERLRSQYQNRLSRDAAESIRNVRVIAQTRFGPYARLDCELTRVFPNGETSILPTEFHFVVDRASGRWFQTRAVSRITLFSTVAELALRGAPPAIERPLDEAAVAGWRWLASVGERRPLPPQSTGERRPLSKSLDLIVHAGRGQDGLRQFEGEHPMVVYYDFDLSPRVVSIASDPLQLNEAERFVRSMQAAYAARDEGTIVAMWAPEDRENERRLIEEAKQAGRWNQPEYSFGVFGNTRKLYGTIPSDEGTVILFEGSVDPMALYLVRLAEGGSPVLSQRLGALGRERLFQDRDWIRALIAAETK